MAKCIKCKTREPGPKYEGNPNGLCGICAPKGAAQVASTQTVSHANRAADALAQHGAARPKGVGSLPDSVFVHEGIGGINDVEGELTGSHPNTDFSGQSCWGLKVDNADLSESKFDNGTLPGSITESDCTDISARGAYFAHGSTVKDVAFGKADFTEATIAGTTFEGADLSQAKGLDSANFINVEADKNTTWPEGFDPQANGIREMSKPAVVQPATAEMDNVFAAHFA